jgi:hypothetical protein
MLTVVLSVVPCLVDAGERDAAEEATEGMEGRDAGSDEAAQNEVSIHLAVQLKEKRTEIRCDALRGVRLRWGKSRVRMRACDECLFLRLLLLLLHMRV